MPTARYLHHFQLIRRHSKRSCPLLGCLWYLSGTVGIEKLKNSHKIRIENFRIKLASDRGLVPRCRCRSPLSSASVHADREAPFVYPTFLATFRRLVILSGSDRILSCRDNYQILLDDDPLEPIVGFPSK
ncbi:hypothetical protein SISNIDRAFT_299683 [Sistotremastrum niveocremeum HHB9708]|uniref:Uncharacterized protein n=1 Tax=Sistotremastrum niveocremeum HHB9708 TaxID=1314777 RepID=A0A164NFG2_9AGAM|nr:hypothetical protein SISNIDRAFT_299683 [Sistotremastrum niveocremeum HHB9708]